MMRQEQYVFSQIVSEISSIKREFVRLYNGNSHIQEILPTFSTKSFDFDQRDLDLLHLFLTKNPIYFNSFSQKISNNDFTVYEGDINDYWINSLKHDSSYQPFYPTWLLSAYLLTRYAKLIGYDHIIDIGSGDGRIAYCGSVLGLRSDAIELDDHLVLLENRIVQDTDIDFHPICADATKFDYSSYKLDHPIFFIGGLPQNGDLLASGILQQISQNKKIFKNACFVFAGSYSVKPFTKSDSNGGWSALFSKFNLQVDSIHTLPTSWTMDQVEDTPYIYAVFGD